MVEITVKVPDNVARGLGANPEAVSRRVLENLVIEEYRAGRLSLRQVGETLGFDYWQAENFLSEHQVPLNYGMHDLEVDRVTLDRILQS